MAQRAAERPAPLDVRDLARRFAGELVGPDHPSYDEARRVWNGSIDRRPAVVARCAGTDDVAAAIRFAVSETSSSRCAAAATASRGTGRATPGW
jgi:FAD/FMN-containing dehydrogenase